MCERDDAAGKVMVHKDVYENLQSLEPASMLHSKGELKLQIELCL